jgi:hypothetical protein
MGLIDFVKSAGEKLFGRGTAQTAMAEMQAAPPDPAKIAAANAAAGDAILDYIKGQNLSATGLTVTFDGATSAATVYGIADDQATKEKIILCCGNVAGVGKVNDMMTVSVSEPPAEYYTVVSGDTECTTGLFCVSMSATVPRRGGISTCPSVILYSPLCFRQRPARALAQRPARVPWRATVAARAGTGA